MKLFVGLDVSLAKTAVCVLTEHGKIIEEVEVISEPEPLISLLEGLEGTVEAVGLEAGPLSQWLHRAMKEIGLPAVLMASALAASCYFCTSLTRTRLCSRSVEGGDSGAAVAMCFALFYE